MNERSSITKINSTTADNCVAFIIKRYGSDSLTYDGIREVCDLQTGGELSCSDRDMLADMVLHKLKNTRKG